MGARRGRVRMPRPLVHQLLPASGRGLGLGLCGQGVVRFSTACKSRPPGGRSRHAEERGRQQQPLGPGRSERQDPTTGGPKPARPRREAHLPAMWIALLPIGFEGRAACHSPPRGTHYKRSAGAAPCWQSIHTVLGGPLAPGCTACPSHITSHHPVTWPPARLSREVAAA